MPVTIADLPFTMAWCLGLTLVLELAAAALLGTRRPRDLLVVALANVMTNPLLVSVSALILLRCGFQTYRVSLAALEAAAVLSEGLVYRFSIKPEFNPFLFSLLLNALSYSVGDLINKIIF